MQQRDYLKDQIDQLAIVLANIIAKVLGLDAPYEIKLAIETSNEQLKTELDIDFEKIIELNGLQLKDYLLNRNMKADHIEQLAQYLMEVGKFELNGNYSKGCETLKKAIMLLDLTDEISKSASFERMEMKNQVENYIGKYS